MRLTQELLNISEAKNHLGETTYSSYKAWKAACKKKDPNVWFDGDEDIAQAMTGPNPFKKGETRAIGEWDGNEGSVYNDTVKEAIVPLSKIKPGQTLRWVEDGEEKIGKVVADPKYNGGMRIGGRSVKNIFDQGSTTELEILKEDAEYAKKLVRGEKYGPGILNKINQFITWKLLYQNSKNRFLPAKEAVNQLKKAGFSGHQIERIRTAAAEAGLSAMEYIKKKHGNRVPDEYTGPNDSAFQVYDLYLNVGEDIRDEFNEKFQKLFDIKIKKLESQLKIVKEGKDGDDDLGPTADKCEEGDVVVITGNVEFKDSVGEIVRFGKDKKFVVVRLFGGNGGEHSFHSSDVRKEMSSDNDDREDDEMENQFFVAIYDEHEHKSFIGRLHKDGKWHEEEVKGEAPYAWGGSSYMSYLDAHQVMDWIHKDYGRGHDVAGPFDSQEAAEEYVEHNWGQVDEAADTSHLVPAIGNNVEKFKSFPDFRARIMALYPEKLMKRNQPGKIFYIKNGKKVAAWDDFENSGIIYKADDLKEETIWDKKFTDFDLWKQAVLHSYPAQAKKMKFKGRFEGGKHTISAEVPGEDRSYGVWDGEEDYGKVLSEQQEVKEAHEPIESGMSHRLAFTRIHSMMEDVVQSFQHLKTKSDSIPSAPNSMTFRAHRSGDISVSKGETQHNQYSGSTYIQPFLKVGGAIPYEEYKKVIAAFHEKLTDTFGGHWSVDDWGRGPSFKTTDGYIFALSGIFGTNWRGEGFIITAPKGLKEDDADARLWRQINDYEKRAKETKDDIKKQHYTKMAQDLRAKLTVTEAAKVEPNIDQILEYLTKGYRSLEKHKDSFQDFSAIKRIYDGLRLDLKENDFKAFERNYDLYMQRSPDAASTLIDAMFEAAGLEAEKGTYEEFIEKCSTISESTLREGSGDYDKAYNLGRDDALAKQPRNCPWEKKYPDDLLYKAYMMGYKDYAVKKPKTVKEDEVVEGKWSHNARTGAKLDPKTGAELPPVEKPVKQPSLADLRKQMNTELKKRQAELTPNFVWNKVENVISQIFPDGDPIDWMIPWFKKYGVEGHKVGEYLQKAAKANGYKDMYDYYDQLKDQHEADARYDAGVNEAKEITNLNDDDWYEYDPKTLIVKRHSGHAAYRSGMKGTHFDLENGNKVVTGMRARILGLKLKLDEAAVSYDKHSFIGKIRRDSEANTKGWEQFGKGIALALARRHTGASEQDIKYAEKLVKNSNRYKNLVDRNLTKGGFPKAKAPHVEKFEKEQAEKKAYDEMIERISKLSDDELKKYEDGFKSHVKIGGEDGRPALKAISAEMKKRGLKTGMIDTLAKSIGIKSGK